MKHPASTAVTPWHFATTRSAKIAGALLVVFACLSLASSEVQARGRGNSSAMRRYQQFAKKQQQEMIEQEWNHPSVIAWSVGNEYEAYTDEGKAWTRDMKAFSLKLDSTRLITFADRYTGDPAVKTGADDASQYMDFVSINTYGGYAKAFDHVHELYPNKPIFVSEFGKMGEPGLHDPKRTEDITTAVEAMKARPYMIGGSLWTWADYRSFINGTPDNGIRSWGVVDIMRQKRDSYPVVQKLFKTELP